MYELTDKQYSDKYALIKNIVLHKKISVINPVAYILGGQPGAGKSLLQNSILSRNYNCVVINADTFRNFHPYFYEIQETFGDTAQNYTQPFINRVTEQLIDELSNEKYNLIIEGTLRTADVPLTTCKILQQKKYAVELHIMAVKKEISYESTILRYERAIAIGKSPRATTKKHHDLVTEAISKNLDIIKKSNAFNKIKIFSRFGDCLYPTGEKTNPAMIENEVLNGDWSKAEFEMLQAIINETKRLKFERKAFDYDDYSKRTDEMIKMLLDSNYYIKVTPKEAYFLKSKGINFEGRIAETGESIIKISSLNKSKVLSALENFRNNNNLKK